VSQFGRLPGLPSSNLALELIQGRDQTIEFEDYLNSPADAPEFNRASLHTIMEARIGMLPIESNRSAPHF